nr:unnamed protein product [Digitaria exilis]
MLKRWKPESVKKGLGWKQNGFVPKAPYDNEPSRPSSSTNQTDRAEPSRAVMSRAGSNRPGSSSPRPISSRAPASTPPPTLPCPAAGRSSSPAGAAAPSLRRTTFCSFSPPRSSFPSGDDRATTGAWPATGIRKRYACLFPTFPILLREIKHPNS